MSRSNRDGSGGIRKELNVHKAETATQLSDIVVNVKKFWVEGFADWSPAIASAIDYCFARDGGTVLLPDPIDISTPINLKENVKLIGNKNTVLNYTSLSGSVIVYHNASGTKDFKIKVPDAYDDSLLLFSNVNLVKTERKDLSSASKVYVENIESDITVIPGRLKNIAIELSASGVGEDYNAGFWGVNISKCYFKGFDKIFKLSTQGLGWINSCVFKDIVADYFINLVVIDNSGDQISANVFDTVLGQCRDRTEQIVINGGDNKFINCYNWDIALCPNAVTGNVNHDSYGWTHMPIILPLQGYASKNFQKVGTFTATSGSALAEFSIHGSTILSNVAIYFSSGDAYVRINNMGTILNFDNLKFYTLATPYGTELYLRLVGIELPIRFVGAGGLLFFFEPHSLLKDLLDGSVELPTTNYIIQDMATQQKMYGLIGAPVITANRPVDKKVGYNCYDVTINKPIWLKTVPSTWVDAMGTVV